MGGENKDTPESLSKLYEDALEAIEPDLSNVTVRRGRPLGSKNAAIVLYEQNAYRIDQQPSRTLRERAKDGKAVTNLHPHSHLARTIDV